MDIEIEDVIDAKKPVKRKTVVKKPAVKKVSLGAGLKARAKKAATKKKVVAKKGVRKHTDATKQKISAAMKAHHARRRKGVKSKVKKAVKAVGKTVKKVVKKVKKAVGSTTNATKITALKKKIREAKTPAVKTRHKNALAKIRTGIAKKNQKIMLGKKPSSKKAPIKKTGHKMMRNKK
jgi:hypothetical protein